MKKIKILSGFYGGSRWLSCGRGIVRGVSRSFLWYVVLFVVVGQFVGVANGFVVVSGCVLPVDCVLIVSNVLCCSVVVNRSVKGGKPTFCGCQQ